MKWSNTCVSDYWGDEHARPSLPVVPNPNPTPPNLYPFGLHDTAAVLYRV